MLQRFKSALAVFLAVMTVLTTSPISQVSAQEHLVTDQELQNSIISAAEARADNLNRIKLFLQTAPGQKVLTQAGVTSQKVEVALPNLTDEELSDLSAKTQLVQSNFAAGLRYDDTVQILLIILIVVAIVAIVVAID